MTEREQQGKREWGVYYTSEENICRLIEPLFLEELLAERERCRGSRRRLTAFVRRLAHLHFLDPACGCGNFLIVTYRRLRELELDVLAELRDPAQRVLDVSLLCQVSLAQFAGIERDEEQARQARRSLRRMQQQMDQRAAELFGVPGWERQTGTESRICVGNALTMDWEETVPRDELDYILGNPPFAGARRMNKDQKRDLRAVFGDSPGVGNMDYVTGWYGKAAQFMQGTKIRAAFVSTNSICQGEQAGLLDGFLLHRWGMSLDFARKSFVWEDESEEGARVHCVVVGFSDAARTSGSVRLIDETGERRVPHLNIYLTPAPDVSIRTRKRPLACVPPMQCGSMANDGGALLLTQKESEALRSEYSELDGAIRPFLGAAEFLHGEARFCLWLADRPEEERESIRQIPEIARRLQAVREHRADSRRAGTRRAARTPELFSEIRQPRSGRYILVPRVSSVRRPYIPMDLFSSDCIAGDSVLIIPGADESLLALLMSDLHMIWVRTIAGRLKSDLRYSASLVYNNFPFPELNEAQRQKLRGSAQNILSLRGSGPQRAPAALYDPDRLPAALREAHRDNDQLVEEICGISGKNEEEKLSWLFTRFRENDTLRREEKRKSAPE